MDDATRKMAFRRLKAGGLIADDPDIVLMFDSDPRAPDYVARARAEKPNLFQRSALTMSADEYAKVESEVLRGIRQRHLDKHLQANVDRIINLYGPSA